MRQASKKFYQFAVMGKGRFPVDMLRHDQCFPLGAGDSEKMEADDDNRQLRTIRLGAVSHGGWEPTEGRWSSFSWPVVRDSFEEV